MKKFFVIILGIFCFGGIITSVSAETITDLTITPVSSVFDANNVSSVNDSAPGFASGSFMSNGNGKTDMYFTPVGLFGREITLGEISSISYWTKTNSTHAIDPRDWYLTIYTKPYSGDISSASWYGDRIGTEPYFSINIVDPANTWNQWSTDGTNNKLRFFESTAGAPGATFGSYTDPEWSMFKAGNALSSEPYATHGILYFSVQTGSAWATGFTGQLDGLQIELTDGSIAKINFEAYSAPSVPVITTPANNSIVNVSDMVKVDWDDSIGTYPPFEYQYEAYSNADYTNLLYQSAWLTASEIPTPGTPPGEYYIRVKAKDGIGTETEWSNESVNPYKITVVDPYAIPAVCKNITGLGAPIIGTNKSEVIKGTSGNDLIFALGGSDKIDGKSGKDCIIGGDGSDVLIGGEGNDVLLGGNGSDSLDGGNGNDKLYGEIGSDYLKGGNGNDALDGGDGSDSAVGGNGTDTCTTEANKQCEV